MPVDVPQQTFIREFGRALISRQAALFIGAGMSRPAGYVDWRELLRDIATDISLDIDQETDLLALAQFHQNHTGNRGKLNQLLLDEFVKEAAPTPNHELIATLPINTIWTTNYDTLIEDALKTAGRKPDVKHSQDQLATAVPDAAVTVFKMHGDVSRPAEAVLTRDDYEEYSSNRQLFSEKLQGDLVSRTFLFLGFSFSDPNIDQILSRIRVLLGINARNHFLIMKRPSEDGLTKAEFGYECRRLELRIQDLKRYGIQTVLIDDYQEITDMLEALNHAANLRNVFVSGSAHEHGPLGRVRTEELCAKLGRSLIESGLNLVTGFGLGIGSIVSMGAVEAVYSKSEEELRDRVLMRPFPQGGTTGTPREQLWTKYRSDMIAEAGHAIFICGNKLNDATGKVIESTGVIEEFELAKAMGKTLIPIGATGAAAKRLWTEISTEMDKFFPGLEIGDDFASLCSSDIDEIVAAVLSIIQKRSGRVL